MAFRGYPQGLRLLLPEQNIEIALRRQSRGVHVRDRVHLAEGTQPGSVRFHIPGQNRDGTSCGWECGSR
jgi:hypothetical protein